MDVLMIFLCYYLVGIVTLIYGITRNKENLMKKNNYEYSKNRRIINMRNYVIAIKMEYIVSGVYMVVDVRLVQMGYLTGASIISSFLGLFLYLVLSDLFIKFKLCEKKTDIK
jgi:hypothetical protein